MTKIFNELAIVGVDITDEDQVVYLLASLPDSYNTLVTALEASTNILTLEVVTECLLHEERKKLECNSDGRADGAMHVDVEDLDVTIVRSMDIFNAVVCRNGKVKERSPKSENKERDATRHMVNKAEVRKTDSGSDVDTALVICHELNSTGDITQPTNCWIIDSGATCHICHERERAFCRFYTSEDNTSSTW